MIAQGNAISHGARAIEYSIDKDKARLVKVNDLPENIEPLAMWSRMMQHQHQCMKDRYNPKPRIWRMSLSPCLIALTEDVANQIVILNRPISKIASMLFHYTLTAKVASLTCTLWLTV